MIVGEPSTVPFLWPCRLLLDRSGWSAIRKMPLGGGTANCLGVRAIPTPLLFKGGQVLEQRVGAVSKSDLVKMLGPHAS